MSKAILLSIHPKWAKKIYSGEKKIEWRKDLPKSIEKGTKVYIYETAPVRRVTGRFTYIGFVNVDAKNLDLSYEYTYDSICVKGGCVEPKDLLKYQGRAASILGWKIYSFEKFSEPKTLDEFGIARAPQSWRYVEE